MKRLILLCDGTLEDADRQPDEARITNIARLSRAIVEMDRRDGKEVEQVKLYQSGVGTDETGAGSLITGALGRGMMEKVKDLYDFLAINWEQGDEIYVFGFSRGAYIARLLACLVDIIGLLPPRQYLHLFPRIFEALDAHTGKGDDDERKAIQSIRALLSPLERVRSAQRAHTDGFLIECVGAFDTVGTRGRPSFLRSAGFSAVPDPPAVARAELNSFGLPSSHVPGCVRLALQALALDEHRKDYAPVLWRRWQKGDAVGERAARQREEQGQWVEQVWFAGAHADIGGGYAEGDLSFLALQWMISRTSKNLAIDDRYLEHIYSRTTALWGEMEPHQSRVDEFRLAPAMDRTPPSLPVDPCTSQWLHVSPLSQPRAHLRPEVAALLYPPQHALFDLLGEEELRLRSEWADPVVRVRPTLPRVMTAPAALRGGDADKKGSGKKRGDEKDAPARKERPSSVTSFTDNEDSPPASPASPSLSPRPSPPSSAADDALTALRGRQGTRRSSPLRRAWDRVEQTALEHARRWA